MQLRSNLCLQFLTVIFCQPATETSTMDRGQFTLMGSTVCVMLCLHFSIQLVSQHYLAWKKPKEQKAIIIIVLMAPLYAINSYVGLLDIRGSETFFTFLESIKECYEALVRFLVIETLIAVFQNYVHQGY